MHYKMYSYANFPEAIKQEHSFINFNTKIRDYLGLIKVWLEAFKKNTKGSILEGKKGAFFNLRHFGSLGICSVWVWSNLRIQGCVFVGDRVGIFWDLNPGNLTGNS